MGGILIEEDLFSKYSILDSNLSEGQRIHAFLQSRAERLLGHIIDFDKTPITFVMSDSEEPNAFFAPISPKEKDYVKENTRRLINPLDTPVICFTKGLIEMVDNIDQLDYVLGHELTHMLMRGYGIERNSKGEEEIADLHAVDLVYDAGGDPKQALKMEEKLNAYGQKRKKKNRRARYKPDEKEEGINWSEIFDVHMLHSNRKSAIKASLTNLSHLIDERTPTDKGVIFNDLPTDTPAQITYKKEFAKSYIVFEVMNVLSGGKFDHDKHGAQLCVDEATGEAGIFDTGAMALKDPTVEEQRLLGNVLYGVMKDTLQKEKSLGNLGVSLSASISDKITELHKNNVDTQYLVEVKKAILALGDFFKVLDKDDMKGLLSSVEVFANLSEEIKEGVNEKMSFAEKAWLTSNLALQGTGQGVGVVITKDNSSVAENDSAIKVDTKPETLRKSSWLQGAFLDPEGKNDSSGGTTKSLVQSNDNLRPKNSTFELAA